MTIKQTQAVGFLRRVFGPEYEIHGSGQLSDLVGLRQAILEPGTESFFNDIRYSFAVMRKADRSLVCLVYRTWDNPAEFLRWDYRSHLEQFGVEHGVLLLFSRSESWEPIEPCLTSRDMQLFLAHADGYPYDFFDGEADDETLEGLFGSATETPNVEGVPVPFQSTTDFDGDTGRELVSMLLKEMDGRPRKLFGESFTA